MNIVKKSPGIILLEQYGNKYIRFDAGQISDVLLQLRITDEEFERIQKEEIAMESVVNYYDNRGLCSAAELRNSLVKDYLRIVTDYSEKRLTTIVAKLNTYRDVFFEFYDYVLYEQFAEDAIVVEGMSAQQLATNYPLSPLGAYNYLIYLREMPDKALVDLKAGLPTKDSPKVEQINNQEEVQATMDEKTTTPVEEVTEPQQSTTETPAELKALLEKLEAVQLAITGLQQSFDDKIAEDAHKNGLFDNMHRELTRYQNGALDKIVDTIALDIIQLVDSTKSHVRVYEKKEPAEENYKKLLRVVKGVTEDLEDILYRQSIESYRVEGHEVDVRRQKIIQTIPTDDKYKDNLVAVRVADGYEKDGKVLRPERIKIFKYKVASTDEPTEK